MRDPGRPEGRGPGVRVGAYVHATDGSGYRWAYDSLEWHAVAWTGLDHGGHRTRATIDGDRLRVQHGDNPEAVRWFTLDELNMVGGSWRDGNPVVRWCAEIDGRGGAMSRPERLATLFVGERPDRSRFDPPSMDDLRLPRKPKGGLWTCREIPGRRCSAWEAWCGVTGQAHLLKPGGRWRLVAGAPGILRIDRYGDLLAALERYPYDALPALSSTPLDRRTTLALRGLDWPTIAEEYDAVEVTTRGIRECAHELPGLTGWDVPTVLWLRWCFEEIEERPRCTTSP